MKTAIIGIKELGTNCWLPVRFCGGRCSRVMRCKYPEKRECKAVQTEVDYLKDVKQEQAEIINAKLKQLQG